MPGSHNHRGRRESVSCHPPIEAPPTAHSNPRTDIGVPLQFMSSRPPLPIFSSMVPFACLLWLALITSALGSPHSGTLWGGDEVTPWVEEMQHLTQVPQGFGCNQMTLFRSGA